MTYHVARRHEFIEDAVDESAPQKRPVPVYDAHPRDFYRESPGGLLGFIINLFSGVRP